MERDRARDRDYGGHLETRFDGGGHKRIPGRSTSKRLLSSILSCSVLTDSNQGRSQTMELRWYNGCATGEGLTQEASAWKPSAPVQAI